ncbi:MAG TPA: alanine racemase [Woeseiaceae bacterium]|nr:alanine racemase [Woeseiaceae bacterium]
MPAPPHPKHVWPHAGVLPGYPDVGALLAATAPVRPVYCIYPREYTEAAREFVSGFPGRVLYAVKANDHPEVLKLLYAAGVRHFDCASLPEVETIRRECGDATCYFMTPVRLRGAAAAAAREFGVRHFMIDHASGLAPLAAEIDVAKSVVFARMAVHHASAMADLSARFGAPPADVPALLDAIRAAGAEPALAFNVGSNVSDPDAYRYALGVAREVLDGLPYRLRLVDIGGGFALSYPGFAVPPLAAYFAAAREGIAALPLSEGGEVLVEPGRALAAPGMSAVVEVLLRKEERLFLNDGMYGIFWELRFKGHERFPVRCWRNGRLHAAAAATFRLFGPTCDSSDALPGAVELPADIRPGDYLEFGRIGAYSLTGRTNFNGHYSDAIVTIGEDTPPL